MSRKRGPATPKTNLKESSADLNFRRPDPQIQPADILHQLSTTQQPQRPESPIEPDTSTWLTRNESADVLRMSVTTIANYEHQGKLHPRHVYRPDSRGIEHRVAVYDPKELVKLRRVELRGATPREPGEVAARSFELFDQGMTVREVVINLRETPELVNSLYESWLNTGGSALDLTITAAAKEALERLVGPFTTVTDLLHLVEKFAPQDRGT